MEHYQCEHYMNQQIHIKPTMRAILIDWLFEITDSLSYKTFYVHRAIKYLDRFLEHKIIQKSKLQLYGAACLSLVGKYCNSYPADSDDFIYVAENAFTEKELFEAEFEIIQLLKYNVLQITYFDIMKKMLKNRNAEPLQQQMAEFIANFLLHYYDVCVVDDYKLAKFIVYIVMSDFKDILDINDINKFYPYFVKIFDTSPTKDIRSKIKYLFSRKNSSYKNICFSIMKLENIQNEFEKECAEKKIYLNLDIQSPTISPNSLKKINNDSPSKNDFIFTCKIGSGTYGKVYCGQQKNTDSKFAIKAFNHDTNYELNQVTLRDIVTITLFNHPNIIRCDKILKDSDNVHAVLELGEDDIRTWLGKQKDITQHSDLICRFIYQIICGLCEIHSKGFIHRDLKTNNIIKVNDIAKISDFGLTVHESIYDDVNVSPYTVCTIWYRAPEILLKTPPISKSLDIWSLGCIIVELLTGKTLFDGDSEIDQLFKIFKMLGTPNNSTWENIENNQNWKSTFPKWSNNGQLINSIKNAPIKLKSHQIDLVMRMFEYDPTKRIDINEIKDKWLIE